MKDLLKAFFDANDRHSIASAHRMQRNLFGVYKPPTLKQLISLRHLLLRTGTCQEVHSEQLLGLTKSECSALLKKLNKMYASQLRGNTETEEETHGKLNNLPKLQFEQGDDQK